MAELLKTKSATDLTAVPLVDPMETLRAREQELLTERLELLEAENKELKMRRSSRQDDTATRDIAAQMSNVDENAPRKGIIHISAFDANDVEYRGKAEDVANLKAILED